MIRERWTEVASGRMIATLQRVMSALDLEAGRMVACINTLPGLAEEIAMLAVAHLDRRGELSSDPEVRKNHVSYNEARKMMGKNFFGIEEAVKHFGAEPTLAQLATLFEIPFSRQTLEECKDTHVLVAVFPLSILDIGSRVVEVKLSNGQPLFRKEEWYDRQAFVMDRGEVGWHLIKKVSFEGSTSKTWDELQALLSET